MWRRTYLIFVALRCFFALSPSYLHPDENYQGPEVIAGRIYSYAVHRTWEFTSDNPIRSAFPLWPIYGFPMLVLRWLWEGAGWPEVAPSVVYMTLRLIMFALSFVLEDWAVYELIDLPRRRRLAILLVASSYVTWTWQTHTFSNSIETILVLWALVLKKKIEGTQRERSPLMAPAILAFILVLGVFNRPTIGAYLIGPIAQLAFRSLRRPMPLVVMIVVGVLTAGFAVAVDTSFYSTEPRISFMQVLRHPIITPWNNIVYNTNSANLALHGSHPYFQHFLVNLPQLLGPMFILFVFSSRWTSLTFFAAVSGILIMSFLPHQEARFLLPAVPLSLASIRIPQHRMAWWIGLWLTFNIPMGVLMGTYHQGGVVPAQIWLSEQHDMTTAFWWKTYSPPTWLLDGRSDNVTTIDLMGLSNELLISRLCGDQYLPDHTVLVAPQSATFLTQFTAESTAQALQPLHLQPRWSYRSHINLDDLDFGDDGLWPTLSRVIGDRGLIVWQVRCAKGPGWRNNQLKDW